MNITIPIYIEQQQQPNQPPVYQVRPLFLSEPIARDEVLQRAVAKFVKAARKTLDKLGKQMAQTGIAEYAFAPDIEERTLSFSLNLKERTAHCKFLFVTFNALGRRIAFTPSVHHLWFEVERGSTLEERAAEVLTDYFRNRDKRSHVPNPPNPDDITLRGKAETGLVELSFRPPLVAKTKREEFRAILFRDEQMDGEWELESVGRCLNEQYPDDLSRAAGREVEVRELARLLKAEDRRPLLLTGPPMAGKTAIIEECVFRRTAKRKSQFSNKNNVWLISPQRLISGMSYLGQWENRLLAILKEAKKRKHILYFDDLLGLFKAGISANSNLNVAQVLKPYIERREVRVLAEITPEAWRVLREQDRGFADLFHLLPVKESSEAETVGMMMGLIRQLEARHRCRFGIEALPTAIDLLRRYGREAAFPGKAAAFLRQLAIKYRGGDITRGNVLDEFQAKSGLSMAFLNDSRLRRGDLTGPLSQSVIGQKAAVDACADVLVTAKARLNDPDRPLATMLFLGPTGVGKTQCAKSLAAYLFGSDERLLRFDMNEFISYDSAARLAGTFDQPEGLLTSAVRRQPFSVVLFDEIEKAHGDVFNLLLQAMGEGRLTDALGRTADFTSAILILTSNLGVKEASSDLGFRASTDGRANEASIYTQAAERFFSPEFFNRLDRIVPFNRLDRATVGRIAETLIGRLFQREGIARRRIVLRVDPRATERVIDAGFHPQLGARALKREIEKQLAQPLAAQLSATPITTPTIIDVLPGRGRLRIETRQLIEAEPRDAAALRQLLDDPLSTIERIDEFLDRIEEMLEEMRPDGPISLDDIRPEHQRYFAMRDRTRALRHNCNRLLREIESASRRTTRLTSTRPRGPAMNDRRNSLRIQEGVRTMWKEMFAAEDIREYLREMASQPRDNSQPAREQLARAIGDAALIETLAAQTVEAQPLRALMLIRPLEPSNNDNFSRLAGQFALAFTRHFGLEAKLFTRGRTIFDRHPIWLALNGWRAVELARVECGTHLILEHNQYLCPMQIKVFAFRDDQRVREAIKSQLKLHREWQRKLAAEEAGLHDDPWLLDPVVRIYADGFESSPGTTIDLRSGLTATGFPAADELRMFVAASLPLPPELTPDEED
jgi:ATP-dependent Clp protease ATP-binding subunit ClpA